MAVERRARDVPRAAAAAVGAAAGLLVLASTAQTTDGFVHANFGGPLDVFSTASSEVLAIGDGASDVSELATILRGPVSGVIPDSPYRVAYEAGVAPSPTATSAAPATDSRLEQSIFPGPDPTSAPVVKGAVELPTRSVIDSQGRVDCTGAVSCHTDPTTQITTVTYPDGVVAMVQKVNELTVVAYKTITDLLPAEIKALIPPMPAPPSQIVAAPPSPSPSILPAQATAAPESQAPAPDIQAPEIDPGPPAPDPDFGLGETSRRPKVNVTRPPMDFTPGRGGSNTGGTPNNPASDITGKVKEAVESVVGAVKDTVNKVIKPGASGKATTSGTGDQADPGGP